MATVVEEHPVGRVYAGDDPLADTDVVDVTPRERWHRRAYQRVATRETYTDGNKLAAIILAIVAGFVAFWLLVIVANSLQGLANHWFHHDRPLSHFWRRVVFWGKLLAVLYTTVVIALMVYYWVCRLWRPILWRRLTEGLLALLIVAFAPNMVLAAQGHHHARRVVIARQPSTTTTAKSTTTTPANTTGVPVVPGYDLHYYQNDSGVPAGYFGPSCIVSANQPVPDDLAAKCKQDLEERVKHDPMLCSAKLRDFGVLPGQDPNQNPDQVESLRQAYQAKLAPPAATEERKTCADKVAVLLDSLKQLRIERLTGTYFTEFVDQNLVVHQTTKQMNPAVNVAMVGVDQNGEARSIKVDCGHQTVSKAPIAGVPIRTETPPGGDITPPPVSPPTTLTHVKGPDPGLPPGGGLPSGGPSQPGVGGQPGNGGAVDHGSDGYSPSDPPSGPSPTTVPDTPPATVLPPNGPLPTDIPPEPDV